MTQIISSHKIMTQIIFSENYDFEVWNLFLEDINGIYYDFLFWQLLIVHQSIMTFIRIIMTV